jgi:hypothetical protein
MRTRHLRAAIDVDGALVQPVGSVEPDRLMNRQAVPDMTEPKAVSIGLPARRCVGFVPAGDESATADAAALRGRPSWLGWSRPSMTPFDILVYAALAAVLAFQVYVTVRVFRSRVYEPKQKVWQAQLVWLLPIIGAGLVFSILQEEDKAHRDASSHLRS